MADYEGDPLGFTPQRIAFAGDWHMNGVWAVHAIEYAARRHATAIVQLGDFGFTFDAGYLLAIEATLRRHGLPLLFVDGNHECFPILHEYRIGENGLRQLTDHVWHLPRGFRWQWGGQRFLALGGAYSVDRRWREPGLSWWSEETLTPRDVMRASYGGHVDALIAHDCPAGVTIPGVDDRALPPGFPPEELGRASEHRETLRLVANATHPTAIWHGHYHRRYETSADLGWGPVQINGLDCDGTKLASNVQVVDLDDIAAGVAFG